MQSICQSIRYCCIQDIHHQYKQYLTRKSVKKIILHIFEIRMYLHLTMLLRTGFPLDCRKNYWINSNLRWNSSWCVSMATAFWELLVLPSPYYGLLLGFPRSTCTENAAEARNFCDWEHGQMSKLLCNILFLSRLLCIKCHVICGFAEDQIKWFGIYYKRVVNHMNASLSVSIFMIISSNWTVQNKQKHKEKTAW